ncbi:MAG: hypothetical protein H0X24_10175 [Ktedonobacterales bacterium]|nr:hypothetical protein [Ktedonobacterales bacterium]
MQLFSSPTFASAFARLATVDQQRVLRVLTKLCLLSPRHPSMQAHRLQARPNLWEIYISRRSLRLLIDQPRTHQIRLWNVGGHQILEWARRTPATPSFLPLDLAQLAQVLEEVRR